MVSVDGAFTTQRTAGNARAVVAGKLASSLATVIWLGLSIRLLGIEHYASYVTAIAAVEISIVAGSFGLDWATLRFAPEFVVRQARPALVRFIVRLILLRVGVTAMVAGAVFLAVVQRWVPTSESASDLALLVAALTICESALRMIRDIALESIGAARYTQIAVLLRTITLILFVGASYLAFSTPTVHRVLVLELVSSILCFVFSLFVFLRATRATSDVSRKTSDAHRTQFPRIREAITLGLHNYASILLGYSMSTQAVLLAVSSFAAPAQVAAFGFICRLFDIARGYMPTVVFMSALRPRFVGIFAAERSISRILTETDTLNRMNTLALLPAISLVLAVGDSAIGLLSGQQIASGGFELGLLLFSLTLRSLRVIMTLVTNIMRHSRALVVASFLSLSAWIPCVYLWQEDRYLHGLIALVVVDDLIWLFVMSRSRAFFGVNARSWVLGYLYAALSVTIAYLLAAQLRNLCSGVVFEMTCVIFASAVAACISMGLYIAFGGATFAEIRRIVYFAISPTRSTPGSA